MKCKVLKLNNYSDRKHYNKIKAIIEKNSRLLKDDSVDDIININYNFAKGTIKINYITKKRV